VRATGGEQGGKLRIETRGFDWKLIGGFLNEVTAWNLRDPGIFGDVRSLLKAAEEGRVRRPRVTYPVRTQPDVGELRLDVRRQRYRIYFAEPPAPSRLVLALAFCKKLPHGDPAAKSTQNADMALAAAVYHLWLEQEHEPSYEVDLLTGRWNVRRWHPGNSACADAPERLEGK